MKCPDCNSDHEEDFKVCPICGRPVPSVPVGAYWAYPKKGLKKDSKIVYVDKVGSLRPIENSKAYLVEDWELVQGINRPDFSKDFPKDLTVKAREMLDDLDIRKGLWADWIERNQDVLDVGGGFVYRLGFDTFILLKAHGRIVPHHQLMASQDHYIRDTSGKAIPFSKWDVGMLDTWEKVFPKMFPVMERVLRDRWFRRDGVWNGTEARYCADFKILTRGLDKK